MTRILLTIFMAMALAPVQAQIPPFPASFTTRDIATNGVTIHVRTGGKGPAPGSFYTEPADVMHFARTDGEPAVVYIFGNGPTDTKYADAAADPRKP